MPEGQSPGERPRALGNAGPAELVEQKAALEQFACARAQAPNRGVQQSGRAGLRGLRGRHAGAANRRSTGVHAAPRGQPQWPATHKLPLFFCAAPRCDGAAPAAVTPVN